MSPKRIKQRFADFQSALTRLNEALQEDVNKSSLFIDAVIQRFEFTFELAWHLAQDILDYNGIKTRFPREVIKEAFQKEMIENGDGWLDMLDDRNKSSHIYDQEAALQIYKNVKLQHLGLLEIFEHKAAELIKDID